MTVEPRDPIDVDLWIWRLDAPREQMAIVIDERKIVARYLGLATETAVPMSGSKMSLLPVHPFDNAFARLSLRDDLVVRSTLSEGDLAHY
jgi:hypothetical protein